MTLNRFFHLLGTFLLLTLSFSADAQEADTRAELEREIDLWDIVQEAEPGVVLLVKLPQLGTWIGMSGQADIEAGIPVQLDDHFRIGSLTKSFVATIVLQLVEEGVLGLDDPMSQWLPADIVDNIPYGEDITLRQLLNMTSGIFDYTESDAFWEAVENDPLYPWTAAETIEYIYGEEAYFPPGDGWYYSNTNYNLLQIIIEAASGSTLADELERRIFDVLGMQDSYLESGTDLGQGIIRGYDLADEGYTDVTEINEGVGLGDGGIISTAEDLALFPRALYNGVLISQASINEMLTTVPIDDYTEYGLGIMYWETMWGPAFGHSGATAGFSAEMWYVPAYDFTVVGLANTLLSFKLAGLVETTFAIVLHEPGGHRDG